MRFPSLLLPCCAALLISRFAFLARMATDCPLTLFPGLENKCWTCPRAARRGTCKLAVLQLCVECRALHCAAPLCTAKFLILSPKYALLMLRACPTESTESAGSDTEF
jgi:hypothetical protein